MPACSDDGERFNDVRREEGSAVELNWNGGVCRSGEKLDDDADGGSGICKSAEFKNSGSVADFCPAPSEKIGELPGVFGISYIDVCQ